MFILNRNNASDKFDFKFSNLQAYKVPKGWGELSVSIVAVETGKVIAKTSRAAVQNGNCRWNDTLKESLWIPEDEDTDDDDEEEEEEEGFYKLVVSMGSSRSGFLGEAFLNLRDYMNPKDSNPISLSLTKCSYGTILKIKIECLNPKTNTRDGKFPSLSTSAVEDPHADVDDMDSRSCESDSNRISVGDEVSKPNNSQETNGHSDSHLRCSDDSSKEIPEPEEETIEGLKSEVKRLKLALDKSKAKEANSGTSSKVEELEAELKFHKESQTNLDIQLKKTQESNAEFVMILQELEETIEKQMKEITELSAKKAMVSHDLSNDGVEEEENKNGSKEKVSEIDSPAEMENLKHKIKELERDCAELTDENLSLVLMMKEPAKDNEHDEVESERNENFGSESYMNMLTLISKIHSEIEKYSELVKTPWFDGNMDSMVIKEGKIFDDFENYSTLQEQTEAILQSFLELNTRLGVQITDCKVTFQKKILMGSGENVSTDSGNNLEIEISELHSENSELQERLEVAINEGNTASQTLNDVRQELLELISSMESQLLANKNLEKKLEEFDSENHELELQLAEVEEENMQFSERISELEVLLRYTMTNDKESNIKETLVEEGKSRVKEDNGRWRQHLEEKFKKLETDLDDALQTNSTYKKQLQEFQLGRISATHGNVTNASSVATELEDLQERYLNLSLKYAETEGQREELVMKLRSMKKGKRWFSMSTK